MRVDLSADAGGRKDDPDLAPVELRRSQREGQAGTKERPSLGQGTILRFHAPIAATVLAYAVAFNIMNSAMARSGPGAAAALASFAVAQSLVDLFAGPASLSNVWIVARGRDRGSLRAGARVLFQLVLAVTAVFAVAGWTPAGRWIYCRVFGAPEHLYAGINAVIRVCLPMPFLWALRNAGQAIIMLRKRTNLMAWGVCLRLVWMWSLSLAIGRFQVIDGALIGGVLWITGIGVEAAFLILAARRQLPMLPDAPEEGQPPPRPGRIWHFLRPLVATSFLLAMGRPIINAAMARTANPELSIAAFQVTWYAAFLLLSLETEFRHTVIIFWTDRESLAALRKFGLGLGCALAAAMAGLGATGSAVWFLRQVLGTPADAAALGGRMFMAVSPVPVLWALIELYVGQLLRNGTTGLVGAAKAANLGATFISVFGLALAWPALGPLIGAIGLVVGLALELTTILLRMRTVGGEPAPAASEPQSAIP